MADRGDGPRRREAIGPCQPRHPCRPRGPPPGPTTCAQAGWDDDLACIDTADAHIVADEGHGKSSRRSTSPMSNGPNCCNSGTNTERWPPRIQRLIPHVRAPQTSCLSEDGGSWVQARPRGSHQPTDHTAMWSSGSQRGHPFRYPSLPPFAPHRPHASEPAPSAPPSPPGESPEAHPCSGGHTVPAAQVDHIRQCVWRISCA